MSAEQSTYDLDIAFYRPGVDPKYWPDLEVIQVGPRVGELRDRPLNEALDVAAFAIDLVRDWNGTIPGTPAGSAIPSSLSKSANVPKPELVSQDPIDVEATQDYVEAVRGAVDKYFALEPGVAPITSLTEHRNKRQQSFATAYSNPHKPVQPDPEVA